MVPSGYFDELNQLEEELAAGDITQQGFEKRKKKLQEKWVIKNEPQPLPVQNEVKAEDEMHPTMMLMAVADTGSSFGNQDASTGGEAVAIALPSDVRGPRLSSTDKTSADESGLSVLVEHLAIKTEVESALSPSSSRSTDSAINGASLPSSIPITHSPSVITGPLPPLQSSLQNPIRPNGYPMPQPQVPYQHIYPPLPHSNRFPPPLYPNHLPPYLGVPSPFYPVAPPQPSPIHHRTASVNYGSNFMPSVLRSHSASDVAALDTTSGGHVSRSSSSSSLDQLTRQNSRPISAPLSRNDLKDTNTEHNPVELDYYAFESTLHYASITPRLSNNPRRISMALDQTDNYLKNIMPFLHKQMAPTKARELPYGVNDEETGTPMIRFGTIASVIRFRSKATPRAMAFTMLDSRGRDIASISYEKLHSRAERIAVQIREKSGLSRGDNVLLVYKRLEFIESMVAMLACFYAGMIAVPLVTSSINLEDEITETLFIMENCRISLALTTDATVKSITRDFMSTRGGTPKIEWWKTNESLLTNTKLFAASKVLPNAFTSVSTNAASMGKEDELPGIARPEELAYVEYSKNAVGELKGVLMDHQTVFNHSYVFKGSHEMTTGDVVMIQLEPRQQFGLLGCFAALFTGCHSVLMPEIMSDAGAWSGAVSKYKVTLAISDNSCMVDVVNSLRDVGKRGYTDLESLRLLFVDSPSPHPEHLSNLATTLKSYGLKDESSVIPLVSVSELGGVCLATRDNIGMQADQKVQTLQNSLEIYVDYEALVDSRVEILAQKVDGKVELPVESAERAVRLCDAGYLFHGVSIIIVEPESRIVLPKNCVGEILVHSPAVFPKGFWALPKLSEQTFRAHPIIYKENEASRNSTSNPYMNSRRASTFSVMAESLDSSDFVRTGLYGFIVDNSMVTSVNTPRLFVTGIRRDLIRQKRTLEEAIALEGKPADYWIHSKEFNMHMASELVETCFSKVHGVDSCAIFSVNVAGDFLPVVLLDTPRPKEEMPQMASQISDILKRKHRLRPFCVAFCLPNSLPRLKPDPNTGTGLQTSFSGYTVGVASSLCGSAKPAFPYSGIHGKDMNVCWKINPVDVELCRTAFLAGELALRHLVLNTAPDISTGRDYDSGSWNIPLKVGQVVGGMLDVPVLDDQTLVDLNSFPTLSHLLRYRSDINAEKPAFAVIDYKGRESKVITFRKFSSKVHSLAHYLVQKRGIRAGDYVLLLYPPGLEYLYALHACLYAGIIPIPLSPPDLNRLKEDIPSLLQVASEFGVKDLLCNAAVEEMMKGRQVMVMVKAVVQQQLAVDRDDDVNTSATSIKSSSESISSISSQKRPSLYLPNLVNTSRTPKLGLGMSVDDRIFFHAKLSSPTARSPSNGSQRDSNPHSATLSRLRKSANGQPSPTAIVLVTTSPDLLRTVTRVSHATLLEQCRLQSIHARILESTRPTPPGQYPGSVQTGVDLGNDGVTNRPLISCVKSYNGLGLVYSTMLGIYVGSMTIVVPPFDFSNNPIIWFEAIHRYQVKDAFATYPMLEHALTVMQDYRSFSLQSVKSLSISIEGRNRPTLNRSIIKTFLANQLEQTSVATTYSTSVNPMVATRGYMTSELTSLHIDLKAMRKGRVQVIKEIRGEQKEEGKDKSTLLLQDSGRIPNNTIVAIVNPVTRRLCSPNEMGEIWVCSPATVDAVEYDDVRAPTSSGSLLPHQPHTQLNAGGSTDLAQIVEGVDPNLTFARTGDVGFLWPVSLDSGSSDDVMNLRNRRRRSSGISSSEDLMRGGGGWERLVLSGSPYEMVLFVAGSLADAIVVNGLRHFPIDVERTVETCHGVVAQEGCVIFKTGSDKVICVIESIVDSKAAILASVPRIVTAVLDEHQFFIDVVCFVRQGHLARSRLQEKQRGRIKMAYNLGKLPTIEVFRVTETQHQ
ncbi:hypothetical protein BC829DRAFT_486260 [Chytridium lagenaria]|nr:hypothetical protein BC829DRAFT_486260 [Chytridium lagenaria]